ncbi:heparin lyase I family protein [Halovulum marinum]|nr:heparin lyase I family protein [Halovulum marinum]
MPTTTRWIAVGAALALLAACGGPRTGGPANYERLFSPAEHAFRFAQADEPVRAGRRSERFELRDGDCGGSDCGAPRYRAEIRQDDSAVSARLDTDIWYGWSFYNATIPAFAADNALRVVVGQWKLAGASPAIFRLVQTGTGEAGGETCRPEICTPLPDQTGDVAVQLADMAESRGWGPAQNGGHVCRLFDMAAARGRWVDIVVNTNFATTPDGYLRIWVDGQLKCDYRGQLVASRPAGAAPRPEHRRGIFVSYTGRWDRAFPGRPKPTLVAFYDEFLSGDSRPQVDIRLRAPAGDRAKD